MRRNRMNQVAGTQAQDTLCSGSMSGTGIALRWD